VIGDFSGSILRDFFSLVIILFRELSEDPDHNGNALELHFSLKFLPNRVTDEIPEIPGQANIELHLA
jgi:hypothetical protein